VPERLTRNNKEDIVAEDPVIQEQDSIEDLSKALAEEKSKTDSYLASLQRSEATSETLKKRVEQEKHESLSWSNAELIKSILPVLDDMEHAFSMIDPSVKGSTWIEGFKIIQRKLAGRAEGTRLHRDRVCRSTLRSQPARGHCA